MTWIDSRAARMQPSATLSTALEPVIALPGPTGRMNLRHISPADFAHAMHELYLEGTLNWTEYCMVGFPSELHPRFDATIGALTGSSAQPDRPRDMLAMWESRVDFERRYNRDPREVRRAHRILDVLRRESGE